MGEGGGVRVGRVCGRGWGRVRRERISGGGRVRQMS